ncbi:hypothetical protein [Helicobacter sp. 11S02629-2]|uniref:hypothetical protein n=1 Tax=Helicobacter sp. 11S02629-2 TaxID=1476195 RepID=UPI000BA553F3|nr:hypothetical protein [Helicobacter sp. 11S02629-2]PAF46045.1 hypothetical protein BKH40_01160 [Helicobacter sp. 11S02629-2]
MKDRPETKESKKEADLKSWLSSFKRNLSPFELRALGLLKKTKEEDYSFISDLLNVYIHSPNKSFLKKSLKHYVLKNALKAKPFSSFDVLQMYLVSLRVLPLGLLKYTMKSKSKNLVLKSLKTLKLKSTEKAFPLAIEVLSPLAFCKEALSSNLTYYKELLENPSVSFIRLDVFSLVSRARFIKDEVFKEELLSSLQVLRVRSEDEDSKASGVKESFKGVLLDIKEDYFKLVLSALSDEKAKGLNIALSIDISLISLSTLAQNVLEALKTSKAKLSLRLICMEDGKEKDASPLYFKASINKYASFFTTLRMLAKSDIKTHIVTNDISIIYLSQGISKDFIYEIDSMLNPSLLKLSLKFGLKAIALKTISPNASLFFYKRLQTAINNFKNYHIKRYSDIFKSDVYKGFNAPSKTFPLLQKGLLKHDFENFKVAMRHRLKLSVPLDLKLESRSDIKRDIAFLSLVDNRILLLKECINCLDKNLESFFTSLYELSDTSSVIVSEWVYNVVDILNFYGYEYKKMLEDSKNIAFNSYKLVELKADLSLEEVISLIASNLLNGNILVLKDTLLHRVLASVFKEALEKCSFIVLKTTFNADDIRPNLLVQKAPIRLSLDTLAFKDKEVSLELIKEDKEKKEPSVIKLFRQDENIVYISNTSDIDLALSALNYNLIESRNIKKIYADSYFEVAQSACRAFKLEVIKASFESFLKKESKEALGSITLFSHSKKEQEQVFKSFKTNININLRLESSLRNCLYQDYKPGFLSPFGTSYLLKDFSLPKALNFKGQRSAYCDVIGLLNAILNEYELEFLRALNSEFLDYAKHFIRCREQGEASKELNSYGINNTSLSIMLFASKEVDFLQAGIILIIANILNAKCFIYIEDEGQFKAFSKELMSFKQDASFDIECFSATKKAFLDEIDSMEGDFLVRILLSQDLTFNSDNKFYVDLINKNTQVVWGLPLIDARVELPKYVHTTSLNIGGT